jgi:hypothetical protein
MKRRAFAMGAAGLLVPSAANAACGVGTYRALCSSSKTVPYMADWGQAHGIQPISNASWNSGIAPANGNVLVAWGMTNGTGSTVTPPAGWTTLSNVGQSSGTFNFTAPGLFWKIASGEPTSYAWAGSGGSGDWASVGMVSVGNGAHATPTWLGTYQSASPATSSTLTPPAPGGLIFNGFLGFGNANFTTAFSAAAGWTSIYNSSTGTFFTFMIERYNSLSGSAGVNVSSTAASTTINALVSFIVYIGAATK